MGMTPICDIEIVNWKAPHHPEQMPKGKRAVYVFSLASNKRVIKVGKAGPKSNARFQSQHYGFSAPSTVAKAITYNPIIWPLLGISSISEETAGEWIKKNTDRWNYLLHEADDKMAALLEIFLRATFAPMLEGVDTRKS